MIKMVGFDLDGTLCDSIPLCLEAFKKVVKPYTDKEISEQDIVATFGLNEVGMIKAIVNEDWKEALQDFYKYYEAFHACCTAPFAGINDLLVNLKGRVAIVLITGKGKRSCEITLEKIGLEKCFEEKYYGSETEQNNKDMTMLSLLEKHSLAQDEFVYVGDAVTDIEACERIGVTCLSAAWQKTANIKQLQSRNPEHVFESVNEVSKYFLEKG